MRQSVLALAVFVSLMIPAKPSFAEWIEIVGNIEGTTFYIDTKIRNHDGYIYYWELVDRLKPHKKWGYLSYKNYNEADCVRFKYRELLQSFHNQPMGRGEPSSGSGPIMESIWGWRQPSGSPFEDILEKACDMAKNQ